jgi:hypothetical protein
VSLVINFNGLVFLVFRTFSHLFLILEISIYFTDKIFNRIISFFNTSMIPSLKILVIAGTLDSEGFPGSVWIQEFGTRQKLPASASFFLSMTRRVQLFGRRGVCPFRYSSLTHYQIQSVLGQLLRHESAHIPKYLGNCPTVHGK